MSAQDRHAFGSIDSAMQPSPGRREPWSVTFLSDTEIAEICAPLVMPAAQRRYLTKMGLLVKSKPNGRPLVARGEFERVLIGGQAAVAAPALISSEPNRAALLKVLTGSRRGP
ncbi:MAG: DUF4224 domain-containing protein [Methylibium sp.]|uniref:DUF4224 domain-containing protein n=1 Tax=Methylibium sp. TaxID=2067992 RepID=UPI0018436DDC|nr:DUF4224 domain-containing protein [Methylibium sp.]MBA2723038.1 DUF4224 domain-containing protein [Methylibium sp.]MBA3589076.1 DUF4224 domain-containing protein [Methylibium sp.]